MKFLRNKLSSNKKTAIIFTFSSLMMSLANIVSGIVLIRWVAPREMGIWNSLIVIQTYSFFMQLGVFTALNREIPYYYGKGEPEKVLELASSALWVSKLCVLISVILTLVLLTYNFIFGKIEINYIMTLISIGSIVSCQFYINYLTVTFRTNKSFNRLSIVYLWQSLIIMSTLFLVYYAEYVGLVLRFLILSISLLLFLHYYRPLKVKSKFSSKHIVNLLKLGLPLFSIGYLLGITQTFSRIILVSFAGVLVVGYYSPALAIISAMQLFPSVLSQYLYPKMSFEVGRDTDKNMLWPWVWKSALGLMLIIMPVAILGWIFLPDLIIKYFPNYISGIFAAKLALISGVFSGSLAGISVLYSLKAWKSLIGLTIFKLTIYWIMIYYFAHEYNPLNGVAIGLLISDVTYFFVAMSVCYFELNRSTIHFVNNTEQK